MARENKPLNRLVEVLETAGDKNMPPVRAIAAAAAAVVAIVERDSKKPEENNK